MRPAHALLASAVLAAAFLAGCSGGGKDRDGDSMYDRQETDGWTVTVDALHERSRHHVTSDPGKADSDGDGLPDNDEYFLGTDPRDPDTDGDGLTDCQESRHTDKAQCEDPGFNGPFDGGYDTDPTKADSDPQPSVYVLGGNFTFADTTGTLPDGRPGSGDGIPDGMEVAGYTIHLANGNARTVHTDPRNSDSDGDHLDDGEEAYLYHSDPTVADTDGDGCVDGLDPRPDQEERIAAGLGTFTLLSGGSAQLRLTMLVANVHSERPDGSSAPVQQGQPYDLHGLDPGPLHTDPCSYTPRNPWVQVQVGAADLTPGHVRSLDIGSHTPDALPGPSQAPTVWVNAQTGALSWTFDGTKPAGGPTVTFEGDDGRLTLSPQVAVAS